MTGIEHALNIAIRRPSTVHAYSTRQHIVNDDTAAVHLYACNSEIISQIFIFHISHKCFQLISLSIEDTQHNSDVLICCPRGFIYLITHK